MDRQRTQTSSLKGLAFDWFLQELVSNYCLINRKDLILNHPTKCSFSILKVEIVKSLVKVSWILQSFLRKDLPVVTVASIEVLQSFKPYSFHRKDLQIIVIKELVVEINYS